MGHLAKRLPYPVSHLSSHHGDNTMPNLPKAGDTLGAYTDLQIALKTNPDDAALNFWFGVAAKEMGKLPEARAQFEKAQKLDPKAAADVGKDAFEVANQLFRRLRGGLGVATVAANAVFAAITGISIASAAVFTRVAVPQMQRYGYRSGFATGVVAGSSVLGMLIPPSLLMILYGFLSNQSVGDMFTAGIVPGLMLARA